MFGSSVRGSPRWLVTARLAVASAAGLLGFLALVSWWRTVGPDSARGPFPPDPTIAGGLGLLGGALLLAFAPDRARLVVLGLSVSGLLLGAFGALLGYTVLGEVTCVEARAASLVASWPGPLPCDALRASRTVGDYLLAVGLVSAAGMGVLILERRHSQPRP